MIRNQKEALLQRKKDRNPQFSGQGLDTTAMEAAPMAQLMAGPGGMSAGAGATAQLKSSSTSNWFPESGGALSAEPQVKGNFQPSGGSSIPEETLGKMESSFGADFGGVKVVENSQQAQQMNAQAFAQGEELHFAPGKFRPGTESGDELLGHELAHVEQQRKGKVKPTTEVNGVAVNDDRATEMEADQQGRRAARGQQAGSGSGRFGASAGAVQAKMNPTPFSPVQRKEEEGEGETTQLKQISTGPEMAPPPSEGVDGKGTAQRKVAQLAGNAPATGSGMPETVVDISQGFEPPQDIVEYLDKNKSKYNKVKVRWGSLGTGVVEFKQVTKGAEGAPGKYKVKEGGYIDYKKVDFLNALEGAGLTPCIVLKGTDPESLSGFLSVRKGEQVMKENIVETVNKHMETLRLLGMTKLTGTAHNTFADGVLSLKAEGLSTQVGGFMNATGGFGIEGDRFVFNLSGDIDIAGLAHAVLEIERNEEGQIRGEADIDVSIANLDGNVKIIYADGSITGRGTASMASEKFSGSVTLVFDEEAAANAAVHSGLGVETVGETEAPQVGGGEQGKRVLVGFGSLTLRLTDWMTATANVGIDSAGHVTVHGQIKFPDTVQLMEQKDKQKDLFDVEIKAGYGVPLVGQIFLFASIGMFVKAGFGPLVLRDIGMEGTYSTDPNIAQNFSITGALAISAYAMAGLRARAGVGLTLLGHDIKAGLQCDASAGVKAYAEARPTFEYKENGPGQKGEAHLKGHFEAAAQLFLELAGAFFVELDSPWWSPAPDKTWEWPFGSVQYPIGSADFGIGADVDWLVGSPDVPEVQFSPVEFDPNKFISDMTKEPDNFGTKGKKGGEQNPEGKWQDGGGGSGMTADPKHTGGGGGNIAAESPNLKNLPDDQKFMRALDDCGKMAKTAQSKPAPQGVVEKRLQEIKDRYGINQITLKNKKGDLARIYVQHTNQNNAKNMIEVKMMSEAERQRLFGKAKKDMEALLKQMGEKETGAINKSQAETAGKQIDDKHDVIIATEVKDDGQAWKVMGDIEDKKQELGSGKKKEGGQGESAEGEGEFLAVKHMKQISERSKTIPYSDEEIDYVVKGLKGKYDFDSLKKTKGKGEVLLDEDMGDNAKREKSGKNGTTPIQRKAKNGEKDQESQNTGQDSKVAMPDTVQAKMEDHFQTDFSNVNMYEGDEAKGVNAKAYTQGNDVHFDKGEFNPNSKDGQKLIAHELQHVVQQSKGSVGSTGSVNGKDLNASQHLESEADMAAENLGKKTASGGPTQLKSNGGSEPIQRTIRIFTSPEREAHKNEKPENLPESSIPMLVDGVMEVLETVLLEFKKLNPSMDLEGTRALCTKQRVSELLTTLLKSSGRAPKSPEGLARKAGKLLPKDTLDEYYLKIPPVQDIRIHGDNPNPSELDAKTKKEMAHKVVGELSAEQNREKEKELAKKAMASGYVRNNVKNAVRKLYDFIHGSSEVSDSDRDLLRSVFGKFMKSDAAFYFPWFMELASQTQGSILGAMRTPRAKNIEGNITLIHGIQEQLARASSIQGISEKLKTLLSEISTLKQKNPETGKMEDMKGTGPEGEQIPFGNYRQSDTSVYEFNQWVATARANGMPLTAGPSGTTSRVLTTLQIAGASQEMITAAAWALFGLWNSVYYRSTSGIHTFHEVMDVARSFGVPYTPFVYPEGPPA